MRIVKKYLLSIDQGTTGTKVLLLNEQGEIHADSYRKHAQHYPKSGWVEHDAEEIWHCICTGVSDAMQQGGVKPDQIAAIGLANQGETVMFWHADTGRPLYPAVVWSCRRSHDIAERWAKDGNWASQVTAKTGLRIDPYFSATKIRWMMDHVPQVQAHIKRGEARCSTLDAWLIWKMTGGRVYATDPSTAARTLLYNIHTGEWDQDILDYLQIDRAWLPGVVPTMGDFGQTDPAAFCGIQAPIRASVVDQPAALFGQWCLEPGTSKCTYGTGCFVYMNAGDTPPVVAGGELLSTIVWEMDGKITYALDGGVYSAGSAINWGMEALQLYDSIDQLQEWSEAWVSELVTGGLDDAGDSGQTTGQARSGNAGAVPLQTERLWFVPSLGGVGAPYWQSGPRGLFLGLSHSTSKMDMARAMLEGIAHRVADVLESMQKSANKTLTILKADGGLTGNPYLMQVQADLLGIPVQVEVEPEATARGVGYMAGKAAGWWEPAQLRNRKQETRIYYPRLSEETRLQTRAQWRRLMDWLLAFYR